MNYLRLIYCIIILGLLGCQGVQQHALKGQALEQCRFTCAQRLKFCTHNCVNNCAGCSYNSRLTTEKNYANYVHERLVMGKKVMRELNSYRDPLQCRKITCDCLDDVALCKKSCTGVLFKKEHSVPY